MWLCEAELWVYERSLEFVTFGPVDIEPQPVSWLYLIVLVH